MHNPYFQRKTMYYGHPQFCEATGTIESCLESGWCHAGPRWKRKKSLDNINFTAVNRNEQQPKQLKPVSMERIKDQFKLENVLFFGLLKC